MSNELDKISTIDQQSNDVDHTLNISKLLEIIEKTKKEMAYKNLENQMIERYLQKNDPKFLIGITTTDSNQPTIKRKPKINFIDPVPLTKRNTMSFDNYSLRRSQNNDGTSLSQSSCTRLSYSQSRTSSLRTFDSILPQYCINYAIKVEITEKECNAIEITQKQYENKMKKKLTQLSANVKEIQITNKEIQNTIDDFNNFVLIRGVDKLTQKIPLEQFIKFTDKMIKNGNTLIEKMRLKTSTLRQNCCHQKSALAIKSELSGILRPVDFDQLLIEKRSFTQTIEEKNAHFIGMKKVAGNVSQSLTAKRKSLNKSLNQLNELTKKQEKIYQDCYRFKIEGNNAKNEINVWEGKIKYLQNLIDTYRAPTAFDYMNEKIKLQAMQKERKSMERKRNIALIKLSNVKTQLRKKKELELARRLKEASMENKFKNMLME